MNCPEDWSSDYAQLVDRNLGFLTVDQQERLKCSKVSVFGVGGIGGSVFEILLRSGIGSFAIVDRDIFESTNVNRQVFAEQGTLGRKKVDVAQEWAMRINPSSSIETFLKVDEDNVAQILSQSNVAALAIDELKPCIEIARSARTLNVPLVEGWAIPFGNVRVIDEQTPTLEEIYKLPTADRAIAEISDEELKQLGTGVLLGLGNIEGIADFYSEDTAQQITNGRIPSFAPVVRLTAVLMAMEVIKVLLGWGKLARGPEFAFYDPFSHKIPGKNS